jgi:hypothetical protein
MKHQKQLVLLITLALMAGAVGALIWLKGRQQLGPPGIIAAPIPGSVVMKIDLPERVLDFTSTNVPEPEIVSNYLPKDTSFVERSYTLSDGAPPIYATIVLMGQDRTSIHRAEYCLIGQGLTPEEKKVAYIAIEGKEPYQLPAAKWKVSGVYQEPDGRKVRISGVYVFWFVTDQEQTSDYVRFQYSLVRNLLLTGQLQRWAYVSYFTICAPGQEDAAFQRMEKLIAASVPAYQLPPAKR